MGKDDDLLLYIIYGGKGRVAAGRRGKRENLTLPYEFCLNVLNVSIIWL